MGMNALPEHERIERERNIYRRKIATMRTRRNEADVGRYKSTGWTDIEALTALAAIDRAFYASKGIQL